MNLDSFSNDSLKDIKARGIEIGAIAAYFAHYLPENPRRAKVAWARCLENLIDDLIGEEGQVFDEGEETSTPKAEADADCEIRSKFVNEVRKPNIDHFVVPFWKIAWDGFMVAPYVSSFASLTRRPCLSVGLSGVRSVSGQTAGVCR